MYVIMPYVTGASKPNERLYQNDRLHLFGHEISLGKAASYSRERVLKYRAVKNLKLADVG
jgi:hypothetical protein